MPPRGTFERRLLLVLIVFSLFPTILLLGLGAHAVAEAVRLSGSPAAWERVAASGRELIHVAEAAGDPVLTEVAARHREELTASVTQARRWKFLLNRSLALLPAATLVSGLLLAWLALRVARRIASDLAAPIRELAQWAERVARGEPLPEARPQDAQRPSEFAVLRHAFRDMSAELAASHEREIEAERTRTWIAMARRVAHELKNPLTPLRLAVHALQGVTASRAPAEREALEVIAAESTRLDELARSFAQFGRLPDGPASEVDLAEMLEYLLRSHLPPAVAHRVIAPPDLPRVVGRHDALSRAFANLILNAADAIAAAGHQNGDGEVVVRLRTLGEEEALEVRLLDNGVGIAAADLERIWEPDFSTKRGGTGLGLAMVRQAIRLHGGRVEASNRVTGGAEFTLVLPLPGSTANGAAPAAAAAALP